MSQPEMLLFFDVLIQSNKLLFGDYGSLVRAGCPITEGSVNVPILLSSVTIVSQSCFSASTRQTFVVVAVSFHWGDTTISSQNSKCMSQRLSQSPEQLNE